MFMPLVSAMALVLGIPPSLTNHMFTFLRDVAYPIMVFLQARSLDMRGSG